jgi:DedD protein
MSDSPDAHLQLKKRARRRLVGAIAFAGLAAVVLPMVMDEEPKQQVQDVQIRIPGQDQTPFNPKMVKPATAPATEEKAPVAEKAETTPAPAETSASKPAEASKAPEKAAEKPVEKKAEKSAEKVVEKPAEKPAKATAAETQRATAILGGKPVDAAASSNGQFLVLIGAFSNPANVKQLQAKIGELGIKVFTESLDSPEGKKTRVRAGPFPNREAADKALEKMKRIGVNGVVAAKP